MLTATLLHYVLEDTQLLTSRASLTEEVTRSIINKDARGSRRQGKRQVLSLMREASVCMERRWQCEQPSTCIVQLNVYSMLTCMYLDILLYKLLQPPCISVKSTSLLKPWPNTYYLRPYYLIYHSSCISISGTREVMTWSPRFGTIGYYQNPLVLALHMLGACLISHRSTEDSTLHTIRSGQQHKRNWISVYLE